MAGSEQNLKLATARPPLDPTRVGLLANFLCFSLTRGIELGSFELVIMKGKGERCTATVTSQGAAPAEVNWPRPDKAWQHEDTTARARAKVMLLNARVEPLGVPVRPCVRGSAASLCGRRRYEQERGR